MSGLLLQVGLLAGQTYLLPEGGYRVADFLSDYVPAGAFDIVGDRVYIQDGDTIHVIDASTGKEIKKYGEPADYSVTNYASFLTVSPDEKTIWAGYTSDDYSDDRIYCIDMESGAWYLRARFPANYDLLIWNDSLLVSGVNSATPGDPNGIYVLDTSGLDQHRLLIEVGGYSAGLAADSLGNLYYGTSYFMDPNAVYRWDNADLAEHMGTPGSSPLQISDGIKLTDVPAGISDCEIDASCNLVFTMNSFSGPKVLGIWNGIGGVEEGYYLDTLAVAEGEWDWLGQIKSMGDFTRPAIGHRLVTYSFGKSLVDLHTADYPPCVATPIEDVVLMNNGVDTIIDLSLVFSDPDDPDTLISKHILSNSGEEFLEASISGNELRLKGEVYLVKSLVEDIELVLEGNSGGLAAFDTVTVSLDFPDGLEKKTGIDVSLYPSPSHGSFVIHSSGFDVMEVCIFSLTGTVVYENLHFVAGQSVDLQELPAGPYLVRINQNDKQVTRMIQKL